MVSRRQVLTGIGSSTALALSGCIDRLRPDSVPDELPEEDYPTGLSEDGVNAEEYFESNPITNGGIESLTYHTYTDDSEDVTESTHHVNLEDGEVFYDGSTPSHDEEGYLNVNRESRYVRTEENGDVSINVHELSSSRDTSPIALAGYHNLSEGLSYMSISDHSIEADDESDGLLLVYEIDSPTDDAPYTNLDGVLKFHEDGYLRYAEFEFEMEDTSDELYRELDYYDINSTSVDEPSWTEDAN